MSLRSWQSLILATSTFLISDVFGAIFRNFDHPDSRIVSTDGTASALSGSLVLTSGSIYISSGDSTNISDTSTNINNITTNINSINDIKFNF